MDSRFAWVWRPANSACGGTTGWDTGVVDQFEHRRKAVEGYLIGQLAPDVDELDHVELIQEQWIGPQLYEIWDCHTVNAGRWWVVTPFANLYSQDDFKSADYTLTFHIGLTQRMMWKSNQPPTALEGFESLDAVFRQVEQATDTAHHVVEVQDAQAAGVALRESLISLGAALVEAEPQIAAGYTDLKKNDFVRWAEAASEYLICGQRKRKLRSYMKTLARETWEYVNWLTHDHHGTQDEAITGARMVQHVVMGYADVLLDHDRPIPSECPACGSRRMFSDSSYFDDGFETTQVCEACEWRSKPEWSAYRSRQPAPQLAPEIETLGPCTPGGDGPGK